MEKFVKTLNKLLYVVEVENLKIKYVNNNTKVKVLVEEIHLHHGLYGWRNR